jgi:putative hydrolase of the HAD superfamily
MLDRIHDAEAVFFDLFHTLYSHRSSGARGFGTSEILGVPQDEWNRLLFEGSDSRTRGLITDKYDIIRQIAHQMDPSIPESKIREAADYRESRFYEGLASLDAPMSDVIRELKLQGKKIGLISNADAVEVKGWFVSPISRMFDSVVFSYAVGFVKPEPEIYRIALDALGVSAERSVFVGDGGSNELIGAKNLGFTTILTTEIIRDLWPERIPERLPYADFVIDRFEKLIGL